MGKKGIRNHGNGVDDDDELTISDGFYSSDGSSGEVRCFQTYKRRKYEKSKSKSKGKAKKDCRKSVKTSSHKANKQGTSKTGKDGPIFSSQFDCISHRAQTEANGHAHVMQNGSSSEPYGHGVTEMCQRVLCNILQSEKFRSLSKTLLESFHGMKPDSVFDFTVISSRMKQKTYEQSPGLFLSDILQVWRKLEDSCNEILALAKSLSNISTNSYSELVGMSAQSTFEDEKQVEFDSHMKPEQPKECATDKICFCSHCGKGADGANCLVCDSCEKMYHLSCIEPALNEIPLKSWYCDNCTTSGTGSPHPNCVVCVRLNGTKTPKKIICHVSLPTNEETLDESEEDESEEDSDCSYDWSQVSTRRGESFNCTVCGNNVYGENKIRVCGHPYCGRPYYHVRCLTRKQLKTYASCWFGPCCICQICLTNKYNGPQLILCDGCDYVYHTSCMKFEGDSFPMEKYFCQKCDAGMKAISLAKKAYESNKLRSSENVSKPANDNNNNCVEELENGGGMDMLLTAANSLNFLENLAKTSLS